MKLLFVSLLSVFTTFTAAAQDVAAVIKEAERLEAVPDELAALKKYKEALKLQPLNMKSLCKCSQLCSRIGQRQKDTKIRDDYYTAAKIYAETALKVDAGNSDANTSMAIAMGRATMTKSGKEKVAAAKDLKKYVDAALKTNPSNFLAWHVLGRWHYEISNLNTIERAAVKVLYGGFPASSLKDGITAFEKAKALDPGFILNYLELAKAYHRNDDDAKAKTLLTAMMQLPSQTEDDPSIKEAGKKLLKDWE
jgi:tetratricopeptide (TPR) repeat protein